MMCVNAVIQTLEGHTVAGCSNHCQHSQQLSSNCWGFVASNDFRSRKDPAGLLDAPMGFAKLMGGRILSLDFSPRKFDVVNWKNPKHVPLKKINQRMLVNILSLNTTFSWKCCGLARVPALRRFIHWFSRYFLSTWQDKKYSCEQDRVPNFPLIFWCKVNKWINQLTPESNVF